MQINKKGKKTVVVELFGKQEEEEQKL